MCSHGRAKDASIIQIVIHLFITTQDYSAGRSATKPCSVTLYQTAAVADKKSADAKSHGTARPGAAS